MRRFTVGLLLLIGAGSLQIADRVEAQQTSNLTIEVTNLRTQDGNICFKLFSGSDGFPNADDSALQRTCVAIADLTAAEDSSASPTPIEATESTPDADRASEAQPAAESDNADVEGSRFRYTFENLALGEYAVAIYHDRNADERLNRGLFGIPSEGYGFSNDAPANLGPADYEDAMFALEETDPTIQIRMRYP
jgi:uncharacterized protein (DUF2141 family)